MNEFSIGFTTTTKKVKTKYCKYCNQTKNWDEFPPNGKNQTKPYCKQCKAEGRHKDDYQQKQAEEDAKRFKPDMLVDDTLKASDEEREWMLKDMENFICEMKQISYKQKIDEIKNKDKKPSYEELVEKEVDRHIKVWNKYYFKPHKYRIPWIMEKLQPHCNERGYKLHYIDIEKAINRYDAELMKGIMNDEEYKEVSLSELLVNDVTSIVKTYRKFNPYTTHEDLIDIIYNRLYELYNNDRGYPISKLDIDAILVDLNRQKQEYLDKYYKIDKE